MSTPQATAQIPEKQKAWLVTAKGAPAQVLKLDSNVTVPSKLATGDVLVKVHAAALNPVSYKLMKIVPKWMGKRPYVAEMDFSGVIVDANGTDLSNGQEVFGLIGDQQKTQQGSLTEYTRVSRKFVTPRPANVSPIEAAGVALVGLTVNYILFHLAKLEPGQSVFINGGSTAVGIFIAQITKAMGCTVTASASSQREEFLKTLGVDHFVDYTKGPVYEQLERNPPKTRYDVFVEAVGNTDIPLYTHCAKYIAPGGVFISVGPQPDGWKGVPHLLRYMWEAQLRPKALGGTPRAWKMVMASPEQEQFEQVAQLVAEGKIKPVIDSTYQFEDALQAYDRIMSKHACGKVIVKVDPDVL